MVTFYVFHYFHFLNTKNCEYNLGKNLTKEDLKPNERNSPLMQKARKYGWLTRLPILKQAYRKKHHPRGFEVEGDAVVYNVKYFR